MVATDWRLKNYLPIAASTREGWASVWVGAVLAVLNLVVALHLDRCRLFYSTFADFVVSMALILIVFQYAQGKLARGQPALSPPPIDEPAWRGRGDPATLAFYQAQAPHYTLSWIAPSRYLDGFLDRLAAGARVRWPGRDEARIVERGFELDATAAMVRKANERFDLGARVMRFDELSAQRNTTRSGPMPACCTSRAPICRGCWRDP